MFITLFVKGTIPLSVVANSIVQTATAAALLELFPRRRYQNQTVQTGTGLAVGFGLLAAAGF